MLLIAYDTKGNTYAMLYDEKGNLQKELKTQQKILFDEFTWQNDGYIHYFADGKLYRLDKGIERILQVRRRRKPQKKQKEMRRSK